ncbi:MAG: DnaA regulatory inactivator Hda [Halopseudomonas sp.]
MSETDKHPLQPHQLTLSVGLRDDATLENFYSHHNDLAVQAVEGVAEGVGEPFVYLWGEAGAGCSHLLQAACHCAGRYQRSAFYLPLDQLKMHGPGVLDGLESLDLICIDQLQQVAGQPEWDEALFHLFNRIRDGGKDLLVAADVAPRQLAVALPDLASRLSWGVVFRIQALDDEGKLAALCARAHDRGIELSGEVAQFIFHRSPRQTSELFELLERLDQASLSAQRKVTIPFVKQVLGW